MSQPSVNTQIEATRRKRDRWLAFLAITLALSMAALILFSDFLTDALTVPLAVICGVPSLWGFYSLLFFRTRRERLVGYFGILPLVIWAACLVSLIAQYGWAADFSDLSAKQVNAISYHLNHLKKAEIERNLKAAELDREALVKLGCFEERNFQLNRRMMTSNNVPELVQMVTNCAFINYNYALRINLTNAGILGVTAHRHDIPAHEWLWTGQWPLDAWQNRYLSVALLLCCLWMAAKRGDSFVGVFNRRVDAVFSGVLGKWRAAFLRILAP